MAFLLHNLPSTLFLSIVTIPFDFYFSAKLLKHFFPSEQPVESFVGLKVPRNLGNCKTFQKCRKNVE